MDVGCSLKPLAASTMTPQRHSGSPISYPNFSKFGPHTPHRNYRAKVNPYVHSQHIKVLKLKHFVYIQYECEMQSL